MPTSMRHRITIQENVTSEDELGGRSSNWQPFMTVWGEINELEGKRFFGSQTSGSYDIFLFTNTKIKIRYRAGISPSMRVSYNSYGGQSKTLVIEGILDDGQNHRFLTLICRNLGDKGT